MSLSCLRSSDPNVTSVDQLYHADSDNDNLYVGNGTVPLCSTTSPPAPSGCVVCFEQRVHAVCSHLQNHVRLVMEGAGHHIDLIKSECPRLLGDATNTIADSSENHGDRWRLPSVLIPIVLLAAAMIFLLVVHCKHRNNGNGNEQTLEEEASADDPDEVKPVGESAV